MPFVCPLVAQPTLSVGCVPTDGYHFASLKSNRGAPDGVTMWGTYRGVHVGVIKTNGKVATVFPDEDQSAVLKGRKK